MIFHDKPGFRSLPWRWSWKTFLVVFLSFLLANYAIIRYTSRQPLFNTQQTDFDSAVQSVQSDLKNQSQELLALRARIEQVRTASENQRQTIRQLSSDLVADGKRLKFAPAEAATLSNYVDQIAQIALDQEHAVDKLKNELADADARLEQARISISQSKSKP